jgi:hypothetical protein
VKVVEPVTVPPVNVPPPPDVPVTKLPLESIPTLAIDVPPPNVWTFNVVAVRVPTTLELELDINPFLILNSFAIIFYFPFPVNRYFNINM